MLWCYSGLKVVCLKINFNVAVTTDVNDCWASLYAKPTHEENLANGGAVLGSTRNRKTVGKSSKNLKTAKKKNQSKPKTAYKSFETNKLSHSNYQNPNRSDRMMINGVYRVNLNNFFTVLVNAIGICLNRLNRLILIY